MSHLYDTRTIAAMIGYIRAMSRAKGVFEIARAAAHVGIDQRNVGALLRRLRIDGVLEFDSRNARTSDCRIYRITAPIELATCWPDGACKAHDSAQDMMAEIEARRVRAEQDRRDHQRFWLSREQHPRTLLRPDPDALDRATIRALQGLPESRDTGPTDEQEHALSFAQMGLGK